MTPWRKMLYKELSALELNGAILDLGGTAYSDYHKLFRGKYNITTVNLEKEKCDIVADLEKPFPIADGSFDAILAINILEHIYNYRGFISEIHRILKPGGRVIIGVPFLVQVHPSPEDYFRYTKRALNMILTEQGFKNIEIKSLGSGVGVVLSQISYNLLHFAPFRVLAGFCGRIIDWIIHLLKKENFLSNKYYPLGYIIVTNK